jgi:hypothetical protein
MRSSPEVRPDVVVDARMQKRRAPDVPPGLAPYTIGVAPTSAPASTSTSRSRRNG